MIRTSRVKNVSGNLLRQQSIYLENAMSTHKVNLDALIKREDFEPSEVSGEAGNLDLIFKIEELARNRNYYRQLRKPDFQRTTDNWSPEMIVDFVKSFLDYELIPSIILWHSPSGDIFVIDGAHRISALIAWVNDDYGNGEISQKFFGYDIPEQQKKLDKRTRELIESQIGSFQKLLHLASNPEDTDDREKVRRGKAISSRVPDVQLLKGNAEKAEKSFLKINSNPTTIDPTELQVIRARHKPNAIATRALIRSGRGHKYWAGFEANAPLIEKLAAEVHGILFGEIEEFRTQSADIPRAGQPYSAEAFKMILDIVNVFNNVTDAMWQEPKKAPAKTKTVVAPLADDIDGQVTIKFLENVKRTGELIAGNPDTTGSLGLDPAVYFYNATGKFHPPALIASLRFAQELRRDDKFFAFTCIRQLFEDFLVRNKSFLNQLGILKGTRLRSVNSLVSMYKMIMEKLLEAKRVGLEFTDDEIIAYLQTEPQLAELRKEYLGTDAKDDPNATRRTKFSRSVQAAAIIREILNTRAKCNICGARVPPSFRSKDHIIREQDGGKGTLDNLQFTHPYCNSGYKEKLEAEKRKASLTV
jgi:hypothetical protein